VLIRNGGTSTLAGWFQVRWRWVRRQVERRIAAAAEGPEAQARREQIRLLRVYRMKGKNAFLAQGARRILHKSYSQQQRFGYPLCPPKTI
jgi:hypothetical protein